MASTNPVDYSLSVALTNVAIMRKPNDFIASLILPVYGAPKRTGNKIWKRDPLNDNLRIMDDARAPGADAPSIYTGTPTTPIEFSVPDHSLADKVPDEVIEEYDTAIRAEADATGRLVDRLFLNYEKQVLDLLDDLPSGSTPTVKFDDYTTTTGEGAYPIKWLLGKYATVEAAIGVSPNSIAMDVTVARAIVHHPRVKEYSQNVLPPQAIYDSRDSWVLILKTLLALDNIFIARSSFLNTAKKGQAASLTRMWSDNMCLFYSEPPSVQYAGLGITGTYTGKGGGAGAGGMKVETGRLPRSSSNEVVAHWYREPVICNSGAGLWITDLLT